MLSDKEKVIVFLRFIQTVTVALPVTSSHVQRVSTNVAPKIKRPVYEGEQAHLVPLLGMTG
jgi:hypothetical protein